MSTLTILEQVNSQQHTSTATILTCLRTHSFVGMSSRVRRRTGVESFIDVEAGVDGEDEESESEELGILYQYCF